MSVGTHGFPRSKSTRAPIAAPAPQSIDGVHGDRLAAGSLNEALWLEAETQPALRCEGPAAAERELELKSSKGSPRPQRSTHVLREAAASCAQPEWLGSEAGAHVQHAPGRSRAHAQRSAHGCRSQPRLGVDLRGSKRRGRAQLQIEPAKACQAKRERGRDPEARTRKLTATDRERGP